MVIELVIFRILLYIHIGPTWIKAAPYDVIKFTIKVWSEMSMDPNIDRCYSVNCLPCLPYSYK